VTISIDGPRDGVTARIHNPGAVPDSVRDSFFEKYASSGKSEGTGLGTYSARLMARTQGGDISMRTSAQGGTTIEIALQAAPESALPASREARAEQQPANLAALGPIRVLVVDDDEFNRLIVRRYLPPPAVVDTAVNGRAAVEAAAADPPDAILMDLDMPIMDGYEAVFHIRGEESRTRRKRAVVIALSSHDDNETRARCLASGFDYYLTKPVTRELLRQTLARLCGGEATSAREMAEITVDDDVRDMIPQFLASRRELASELFIALGEGDRERLRRTAHKLSGSFALYGMRWAADHCRALELDAQAGDVARLADMISRLRAHLDAIKLSA
jgi:CheY-like chemotaxis protein/HPt (histidine-containing phosphotransfer) domain-containing protein